MDVEVSEKRTRAALQVIATKCKAIGEDATFEVAYILGWSNFVSYSEHGKVVIGEVTAPNPVQLVAFAAAVAAVAEWMGK